MKLKNELPGMIRRFAAQLSSIETYAPALAKAGGYNDYLTRLAWDVLRSCYSSTEICAWYEKYNCNDGHITTAARAALLAVYPAAAKMGVEK